jgi:hypothetical protein
MKKILISIFIIILFGSYGHLIAQCLDPMNVYSFVYQQKTYEIIKEQRNWEYAVQCALERGGYLIEIGSLEEQQKIFDEIMTGASINPAYTTVMDGGGVAYIWIGATDKHTEGNWVWDGDGDTFGTNFWIGQGAAGTGGGVATDGSYHNWGGKSAGLVQEPDNFGSDQDVAAIALNGWPAGTGMLGIAGEWNDIQSGNQIFYIIEYDTIANSIGKFKQGEFIQLYPNPTNGRITITAGQGNRMLDQIRINNLLGSPVIIRSNIMTQNMSVDLSTLPQGLYIAEVRLSDGKVVYKKVRKY